MWVFTTEGFFSVVAHRTQPDSVLVRTRVREDLVALAGHVPTLTIVEDGDADYRWRAVMKRSDWEGAVARLAAGIDYDNFKGAVARRSGKDRAGLYGDVWSVLRALQNGAE